MTSHKHVVKFNKCGNMLITIYNLSAILRIILIKTNGYMAMGNVWHLEFQCIEKTARSYSQSNEICKSVFSYPRTAVKTWNLTTHDQCINNGRFSQGTTFWWHSNRMKDLISHFITHEQMVYCISMSNICCTVASEWNFL